MKNFTYVDKYICFCFGGGGNNTPPPTPPAPPPPLNTPVPPGSDSYQRFQEIRKGMITGNEAQLLQSTQAPKLGVVGSNVT